MKNKGFVAVAMLVVLVCISAVPRIMNYQGKLTDRSGVGVTGVVPMTFRLYTEPAGGSPIWEETRSEVEVTQGLFSVTLGLVNPFPSSVNFSEPYYLEVVVDGEPMTPRERLASAPYAIRAGSVDTPLQSVSTEVNPTRRTGTNFVLRAGDGATLSDEGANIYITLGTSGGSSGIPPLLDVLTVGNSAGGRRITDLGAPEGNADAATKLYVDSSILDLSNYVNAQDSRIMDSLVARTDWTRITNKVIGAGDGLGYASDVFSVNVDDATLEISSDILRVKAGGIDSTHIRDAGIALTDLRPDVQNAIMASVGYAAGTNIRIAEGGTSPDTIHVVQGPGSNLNADLLDGYSSESFAAASSGVCYTNWGQNTCAEGFTKVVDGYIAIAGGYAGNTDYNYFGGSTILCTSTTFDGSISYPKNWTISTKNGESIYPNRVPCAICCK